MRRRSPSSLSTVPATASSACASARPPILALAVLDAALDAWDGVDLQDIRRVSMALCDLFVSEVEARCPGLVLASPRQAALRGSQVSFCHPEGYAIMQALIARGVIGDFRAPDVIRFGVAPLYIGDADVLRAVAILEDVVKNRLWDEEAYRKKASVT